MAALWTPAENPAAVSAIAHGAGAGMAHPLMAGVAQGLAEGGVSVLRFNFPYMDARRRVPDPAPVLLRTWETAVRRAQDLGVGLPLVVGGKSLGGRMASMLAAAQGAAFPAAALVLFGYPLHPRGKADRLRDAHLAKVRAPMLFLQGTRDPLARLDLIEKVVEKLPRARLHVVLGADHSFRVPGVRRSDRDSGEELGRIAALYVHGVATNSARPAR